MEVCPLQQEVSSGACNKKAWSKCGKSQLSKLTCEGVTAERKMKFEQDGRIEMNQREGPDQSWGGEENQNLPENKSLSGSALYKIIRSRTSGMMEKLSWTRLYYKVQDNWFYLKMRERKIWMSNPMQSY